MSCPVDPCIICRWAFGLFPLLGCCDQSCMNICVQVYVESLFSGFQGVCTEEWNCWFFLRNRPPVFHCGCLFHIPPAVYKVPVGSHLCQRLLSFHQKKQNKILNRTIGCAASCMVLICVYPGVSDAEYLLGWVATYVFREIKVQILCPVFTWVACIFVICNCSLHTLDTRPSHTGDLQIRPLILWVFSSPSWQRPGMHRSLMVRRGQCIFSFMLVLLLLDARNHY